MRHRPHHHGRHHHHDAEPRPEHRFEHRSEHRSRGPRDPRGPRERSLGRFFAHGDLRLVVLHLVAEKPRHGYEIIKAIEDRVAGAYSPSPGVIYPTLTLLEELGHVTVAAADGGKKLHAITDAGRAALDANRPALDALLARMDEAAADAPAAPVLRASENLRLALRLRLARGRLTDEQAAAVAAALDAAAAAVERT